MTAVTLAVLRVALDFRPSPGCDSPFTDWCRCHGLAPAHGPTLALLDLARVMRHLRRGPASGVRSAVLEFATIPPGLTLGDGLLRRVQCHVCGSVLRPGAKGPVTRERAGRWRHGRASGGCPGKARVPRGGRTLEKLLRGSVKEVSRG